MKTIKDSPGREKNSSPTHKVVFNQVQNEINVHDNEAVTYCEKEYPETCRKFKNIMAEQYVLFCKKQKNYGPGNISVGTDLRTDGDVKLSLTGLWFRINDEHKEIVEEMQKEYPETCDEFLNIMADQYVLFCKKQKNYGPGNISVGTDCRTDSDVKLSLTGLWFRLNDKVQRLKQLIVLGHKDTVGESELDTYQDLSVYGIIAQIVSTKKWGK